VGLRALSQHAQFDSDRFEDPDQLQQLIGAVVDNTAPITLDRTLLWRNEPNVAVERPVNPRPFGEAPRWRITTNSRGFRGAEIEAGEGSAPPYRILCVGDSTTFGFNVDDDDTYPVQLERTLRERHPEAAIEVINSGVVGWSWLQGLRFLETEGADLRPDLIIAAHGTNDLFWEAQTTDAEHMRDQQHPLAPIQALIRRTNIVRLAAAVRHETGGERNASPACRQQIAAGDRCRRVSRTEIERYVREVAIVAERLGAELIVMNADFLGIGGGKVSLAVAEADGLRSFDGPETFRRARLRSSLVRANELRLRPPYVPTAIRVNEEALEDAPPTREIILRVMDTPEADSISVEGRGHYGEPFEFNERMYDDATHGDEKASDGVFSVRLMVPEASIRLLHRFYADGIPEFEALAPMASTRAARLIHFTRDSVAPIESFGVRPLMAERVHPNAEGHGLIAMALADAIEGMPTFVSNVDLTP
jgi:lysophospholipase L1-like esterase